MTYVKDDSFSIVCPVSNMELQFNWFHDFFSCALFTLLWSTTRLLLFLVTNPASTNAAVVWQCWLSRRIFGKLNYCDVTTNLDTKNNYMPVYLIVILTKWLKDGRGWHILIILWWISGNICLISKYELNVILFILSCFILKLYNFDALEVPEN